MVVLHIDWRDGNPVMWGEGAFRSYAPAGTNPYSLTMRGLLIAVRSVMWYQDGFVEGSPIEVELPSLDGRPIPSFDRERRDAEKAKWKVESIVPSAVNLLMFLSDVKTRELKPGVFLAPSVLRAAELFRFVARMAASGRYVPTLEDEPDGAHARWRPILTAAESSRLRELAVGKSGIAFFKWMVDRMVRHSAMTLVTRRIAPGDRFLTAHDAWLAALRTEDGLIPWTKQDELSALRRDLEDWRESLNETPEERAELNFRLVPPPTMEGDWKIVLDSVRATRRRLLALGQATLLFPALRSLKGEGGSFAAVINRADADAFVRNGAAALASAGYAVTVPEGIVGEHVTAVAEVSPLSESSSDAPVAAKLTIRVAGEVVGEDEIQFLLDQNSPMVYFRGHWIEVDRNILREALRALRSVKAKKMKVREAIAFSVGLGRAGHLKVEELKAHGWLRGLLNELSGEDAFTQLPTPAAFHGELKPFQTRGFSWLTFLAKWGFGACLADDMGLGKTIQAIALILQLRGDAEKGSGPVLVVAPLTVLGNWRHEFARFAPSLKVMVHHGSTRATGLTFAKNAHAHDVVLTSYNLLVKDFRDFSEVDFSAIIADEAQTIKNPLTRTSRVVRSFDAPVKVALTGTPLENSVNDLWALEEFLNPGLLGTRAEFASAFAAPIAGDVCGGAMKKLKRVLQPFILRRLKTDPAIDLQLGEKRETREYCPLTEVQRRMYEDALYGFREDREEGESASVRRGRVLALLTELKEICDSPALTEGNASADLAEDSGKLQRLDELLEEIFANGESALIFTQYARMGELIRSHLLEKFGRTMPFLHGGLETGAREAEIAAFNESADPCAFILSLRAGGFGLNLVKATHVIHFDRWWNPAVEAQATDRAYRIGQTRTVYVHTFICSGTVEDRVDRLLESKRQLAAGAVTSGESFLASMSDEELNDFVELEQ